jgi:hypothetical protein
MIQSLQEGLNAFLSYIPQLICAIIISVIGCGKDATGVSSGGAA